MPEPTSPSQRVAVVGSLNMDLVIRTPRLPAPGETALGSAYRTYPGGKGANQAVAARRMGAQVALVGVVGDDPHGTKVRQALEPEGIDLSRLLTRAGETTGLGLITVADGGENTIVVSSGANATLTAAEVDASRALIEQADVLLLQLEVPMAAVARAAAIARGAGRRVVLNAAPAREVPPDLMKLVDVLMVNRAEAARLLGLDPGVDPARLSVRLPELGPPAVILTLGAMGSILSHRGRPRRFNAPSVQAVDATAAGDAFCGCLAAWWAAQPPAAARSADEVHQVERAMEVASAAGALAATRHGAIPSLPARDEVLALLAKGQAG
jgi:ribokinase